MLQMALNYFEIHFETRKLDDSIGLDTRLFIMRLDELVIYQLKVLLSNMQFNSQRLIRRNYSKLDST